MIEQISVSELHELMPVPLIDVREKFEFDAGHVPGAEWIPMSLVPLRTDDFSANQPTYVICRTGNRSGQVVMWLASRGIRAINVDGGTEAWQRAGYPVNTLTGSAR
jgi:rhodanese-related sulfurtransferase